MVRDRILAWWRHQMETFPALLALCAGNSPVTGEFPAQKPVTRSFDVLLDLRLNKWLRKQSSGWCLRRHGVHYDVTVMGWPASSKKKSHKELVMQKVFYISWRHHVFSCVSDLWKHWLSIEYLVHIFYISWQWNFNRETLTCIFLNQITSEIYICN